MQIFGLDPSNPDQRVEIFKRIIGTFIFMQDKELAEIIWKTVQVYTSYYLRSNSSNNALIPRSREIFNIVNKYRSFCVLDHLYRNEYETLDTEVKFFLKLKYIKTLAFMGQNGSIEYYSKRELVLPISILTRDKIVYDILASITKEQKEKLEQYYDLYYSSIQDITWQRYQLRR